MSNKTTMQQQSASGLITHSISKTRLSGSRLVIARVIWLSLVIPSLILYIASIPVYYAQIQQPCIDVMTCNLAGALSAKGVQNLPTLGLSTSSYVTLFTLFLIITALIWSGVGFLIFWRRSDDWFALLTAFFLVMFNITYPDFPITALTMSYPILSAPIMLLSMLGLASLALFLVLFPNGQLVPRWMVVFLLLAIFSTVSTVIPSTLRVSSNLPGWLTFSLNLLTFGSIMIAQFYRYIRVSSHVERQQTKWVVTGIIVVLLVSFVILPIFSNFFPALNQDNMPSSQIFGLVAYPLVLLSIPISIGFAILHYRLYDIDRIINRTLVYGSLTIILALVYFGLIFALQFLLSGIINRNNDVAIVVSTLIIAALFQPLRHRIQRIIDRRFYRSKYDAAKVIEGFSSTLREEVDLDTLSKQLVTVVQETMQPEHVSLWLRKPEREVKHE